MTRLSRLAAAPLAAALSFLAGCGGGSGSDRAATASDAPTMHAQSASTTGEASVAAALALNNGSSLSLVKPDVLDDASRLAAQATFGGNETLIQQIRTQGDAPWIAAQIAQNASSYTSGGGADISQITQVDYCSQAGHATPTCWRDNYSTEPLQWDFYRNAVGKPDQLRQRVAFALGEILVISGYEVSGTYGFRRYHNNLLQGAFGNYRDVLKKVILSPMMGEYLDHVNNDPLAPNENMARELMQLMSIGTCKLTTGGALASGSCQPTYDNTTVRQYAFALTGWTYAPGGSAYYGCWPTGANCAWYGSEMVASTAALRDKQQRQLLSGVSVAANTAAAPALELVLDSLMKHANMAPFVSKKLIQFMVSSNPSTAYVQRVAKAFTNGRYTSGTTNFGAGVRGDLAATVAAILLDSEARSKNATTGGYLREPVLLFTGVLRALGGSTDGAALGWWWGENLRQRIFNAPSVFNYYPSDYPVAGTTLVGPQFGIHNVNTALERFNYLTYLLDWGGSTPDPGVPNAIGTKVNLATYDSLVDTPATLVDNLALVALGKKLTEPARQKIIDAVTFWTAQTGGSDWRRDRVATAAYLVFASPQYHVQR